MSVKKFKPKRALVWIAIIVLTRHFACPVMVVKFRSICIIFCFVYYNHSIIFGYKYMQLGSYYIEPWPIVFYQNFCALGMSQTFSGSKKESQKCKLFQISCFLISKNEKKMLYLLQIKVQISNVDYIGITSLC